MHSSKREAGTAIIAVLLCVVLIGGLTAASLTLRTAFHKSASESLDRELALGQAESGVSYYTAQLSLDKDYFIANPAPHSPIFLGGGQYELQSADALGGALWNVVMIGRYGGRSYRLGATIGNSAVRFPEGIVVSGTGNPGDNVFRLGADGIVGSYDPDVAAFSDLAPNANANVGINGSLQLDSSSTVHGNVQASGTLSSGDTTSVNGSLTENGAPLEVESIDPIVNDIFSESLGTNDNSVLSGIFGASWSPVADSNNYGDLIIGDGGTYTIPAGTYRFRRFEVRNGTKVVFDTSSGPVNLVYVGSGAGTGSGNDLIVDNGGSVTVNPGSTTNGLLTVLGSNADFKITNNSLYGQATTDPDNAGYTQIISLGGNASSDDILATGGSTVYGRVYATAHDLTVNGSSWYGSATSRTADITNGLFAVDEGDVGSTLADPSNYAILARWDA